MGATDEHTDGPARAARRRGRPRSEAVDHAVLAATLELAGEVGLLRMSMDEVAERAGVSKATIYRRWATKEELVLAALKSGIGPLAGADTGALRSDLTRYLAELVERLETGRMSDVLPHLIAVAKHDQQVRTSLDEYIHSRRAPLRAILDQARRRGEIADSVDDEVLIDALIGPLLQRRLVTEHPLDLDFVEQLLDLVLPGVG